MALFRLEKAEALGLTYEEYTLELLERGRYLQRGDTDAHRRDQAQAGLCKGSSPGAQYPGFAPHGRFMRISGCGTTRRFGMFSPRCTAGRASPRSSHAATFLN